MSSKMPGSIRFGISELITDFVVCAVSRIRKWLLGVE
jgi:hypothetical protein